MSCMLSGMRWLAMLKMGMLGLMGVLRLVGIRILGMLVLVRRLVGLMRLM